MKNFRWRRALTNCSFRRKRGRTFRNMMENAMRRLIVSIPEGYFLDYFVYSLDRDDFSTHGGLGNSGAGCRREWSGRMKFRGEGASADDVRKLIGKYLPEAVAVRILYGGEEFTKTHVYGRQLLEKLNSLVPQSPFHIPGAIRLIKDVGRIVPAPEIYLYFETAFFANIPVQEQTYALDNRLHDLFGGAAGKVRRFGYHGLFHSAVSREIKSNGIRARRVLSVCLEPVPEVAGIYDGKPVTVSSGSTPLEGLPGNSTCGEIDPGIVLLLEERKKWGPERINDMLERRSGLTAIAGEHVTVSDVFNGESTYDSAKNLFRYRVLLSCGSAAGVMNGFDAVAFSGRYVDAAERLSEWLVPKLLQSAAGPTNPSVFFFRDPLDQVIAESCCRSQLAAAEL